VLSDEGRASGEETVCWDLPLLSFRRRLCYVMLCSFRFADSGSISMASNRICHFKLVLLGDSAG
jgi:hypothetical protein